MKRRVFALLLAVLMVVVAACSGDDATTSDVDLAGDGAGPEAPPGASTPTTTIVDTGASTTTVTGETDAPAQTTTTQAGTDGTSSTETTVPPSTTPPPANATSPSYAPSTAPDGAYVRIGDDYFPFVPDQCLIYEGIDAVVTGAGEAPDGTPIYVALEFATLRVDLGTDGAFTMQDEHWAAGEGSGDDMVVLLDNWDVTAEGTFVYGPTQRHLRGEFFASCEE